MPTESSHPTKDSASRLNTDDITRFLGFLEPGEEVFSFALFGRDGRPLSGFGVAFGTQSEIIEAVSSASEPVELHVTLNRTKLTGRKNADIESVRVFCVDLDREVNRDEIRGLVERYEPQLVVESSPAKYHMYWRASPKVGLEEWSGLQAGLAGLMEGDPGLASISHMIRVPGVSRVTKSGQVFLPRIVWASGARDEYTAETLRELIPDLSDAVVRAAEEKERGRARLRSLMRVVTSSEWEESTRKHQTPDMSAWAAEPNRNSTLYALVRAMCFEFQGPESEVYVYGMEVAAEFNVALRAGHKKGALPAEEVESVVRSAVAAALVSREKRREREKRQKEAVERLRETFKTAGVKSVGAAGPQEFVVVSEEIVEAAVEAAGTNGHNGNGHGPVGAGVTADEIATWKPFEYDFDGGELQLNRYSEPALVERVVQKFGDRVLRVGATAGRMYAFDAVGRVWRQQAKDDAGLLKAMILSCVNDMVAEEEFASAFAATKQGVSEKKLALEVNKWKTGGRVGSILGALWDSEKVRTVAESPFDKNPNLFFCANGVVDLSGVGSGSGGASSVTLREARAADYMLRRSHVRFDRGAGWEWWEEFLGQVFAENTDPAGMVSFLQEVFGYSLTGEIGEQMLFIHYGAGANGKSRVLSALSALTGEYCGRLQPDSLGTSKHTTAKALERIAVKMESKRTLVIDDLDSGMVWSEGLVKSLTEKTLIARKLYEEERDITNQAKVHIGCNEIPKVQNSSHAVYRRLAILEYARRFPVSVVKYREIEEGIERSLSGILNWAIAGLARVRSRGSGHIFYPEEVLCSVEEYIESNSDTEMKILQVIRPGALPSPGKELGAESSKDDTEGAEWVELKAIYRRMNESGALSAVDMERLGLSGFGSLLGRMGFFRRRVWAGKKRCTEYLVKAVCNSPLFDTDPEA